MEGTCIKSVVKSASLCLEAWSIIENKVEYKRFMSQLKHVIQNKKLYPDMMCNT